MTQTPKLTLTAALNPAITPALPLPATDHGALPRKARATPPRREAQIQAPPAIPSEAPVGPSGPAQVAVATWSDRPSDTAVTTPPAPDLAPAAPDPVLADAFPGELQDHWRATAAAKGFDLLARVKDRYHLALRCRTCRQVHRCRIYTLMSARPLCPACLTAGWRRDAEAAGLVHLGRDPEHRHYSRYRAPCGHEIRRQHEMVRRMAAGRTGHRCTTCHAAREAGEARARGWQLLGPDPAGVRGYRLYAHAAGCGAAQRIARINMQSGRFDCAGCGETWSAAPSFLYAMTFTLATGREVVKLGHARDPVSRLEWQLRIDRAMPCAILRTVAMGSGRAALRQEKRLHARLTAEHPEAVVPPERFAGQIRVRSEIYDAALTPRILALLDAVAAGGDGRDGPLAAAG